MKLLNKVFRFVRNPQYQEYQYPSKLKWKVFLNILGLQYVAAFLLAIFMEMVSTLVDANLGQHAIDSMFEEYPAFVILLLAVGLAPLIEELIFRAPLGLFRTSRHFSLAFYISVIAFAAVHLFNFENYEQYLWLSPILVAPQLVSGVFLGFIRVRMGLAYSILLHAAFNFFILAPIVLIKIINPDFS